MNTSEMTVTMTPEEARTFFNKRIREKRSKGHSFQMITEYAAQCSVPIDQLHDLTPEEIPEVERLRVELKKRAAEEAEREERRRIEAQEAARQELARRRAKVEAVGVKAKETGVEIVPVDPTVYDELAALGIVLVSLSFHPTKDGREWTGYALNNDCREKWEGGGQFSSEDYSAEAKDYRLHWHGVWPRKIPDPLQKALQSAETGRAWLESKFPGSENTLLGTIEIHVPSRTAILSDCKELRDLSEIAVIFDILAEQKVATVNIEFHAEDERPAVDGVDFLDADGKAMEIDIEDLEGGCFEDAFEEHWKEYASEGFRGDSFRPRYAHADDGDFFQDASGTVTFDILERKVTLSATATVERVVEEEEDIEETWDVDETETQAA
jgi:FtsZ-interacting cell division protein YlmF